MTVLAIALPTRERPAAGADAAAAVRVPGEFNYVLSPDGQTVGQSGRAAIAALPRADRTVLVMADADVSWHRVELPKAPAAKLRAALGGVMEDELLTDDEDLHLALAPGHRPGRKTWVAATQRAWIASIVSAFETAGREIDKVVPGCAPVAQHAGHFSCEDGAPEGLVRLVLCRKDGVLHLRLNGNLARALLPGPKDTARWTASPTAAAAAERWLGQRVNVVNESERVLAASRSPMNLRQFGLVADHRGLRAVRGLARGFLGPAWRPVRLGLVGLLLVNVVGLNAYAWQQKRALVDKRVAMDALLRETFPNVRTVLDAPQQMRRETERARALAGRVGDGDFEALLGATAAAWPDGAPPVSTLRFEGGRLTLASPGLAEPQVQQLRERLQSSGYAVEQAEGRLSIGRSGS